MVLFNKFKLWVFYLLLFVFGACTNINETKNPEREIQLNELKSADSLLGINPALALSKATEILKSKSEFSDTALLICGKAYAILGQSKKAYNTFNEIISDTINQFNTTLRNLATFEMGKWLYYQGHYDSALNIFNQLIPKGLEDKEIINSGYIFLFKGKCLRVKGDYGNSQQCYIKCREIAQQNNDLKLLSQVLISMGKNDIIEGNKEKGLRNYLQAYQLSEKIEDYLLFGDVCNHLGGYYLETKQYTKALEYHKKALNYRKLLGSPDETGQSYNNIGKTFLAMRANDSARYYFDKSIWQFKKSHYLKGLIKSLTNIGKLSLNEKKYNEAQHYLQEGYDLATNSGYTIGISEAASALGHFYLSKNKADSALFFYNVCIDKIKTSEYYNLISDVYSGMYKAFLIKRDYRQALDTHEKLLFSEKQRLNVESNRQLASMLHEFDYERKEKDNSILKKENELKSLTIKRNQLIIWFALVALVLTIVLLILFYSKLKFKEKANKELEKLNRLINKQNSKLEKINSHLQQANRDKDTFFSIIAHELRNPLFWFQNLTATLSKNFKVLDEEKLQKSIVSLNDSAQTVYHLMDNLLLWSRAQLNRIVPRMQEIIVEEKINEINKLFKNITDAKEIRLDSEIPENLSIVADSELLLCILRNLVSNAIKFTPNNGRIKISVADTPNFVRFGIADTGNGFPSSVFEKIFKTDHSLSVPGILNEKGSGLGLKLCKEFIAVHQGKLWLNNSSTQGSEICFSLSKNIIGMDIEKLPDSKFETSIKSF